MDQQLFLLINREWTGPALDLFMAAISSWGMLMIPVLILVVVLVITGDFHMRAALLVTAAAVGIADGGISAPLKDAIGRPRPHEVIPRTRIVDLEKAKPRFLALFKEPKVKMSRPRVGEVRGKAFPSSHTLDNFCAAIMLAFFFRRFGWLYFLVAGLVGYSRIYTGSHWPSDVLASAFLGVGLGLMFLFIFERLWRAFGPRLLPALHQAHPSLLA